MRYGFVARGKTAKGAREVNGYVHQVPGGRGGRGHAALFGTVGEILTEKVGHLNLGVEGMMAHWRLWDLWRAM